MRAVAYSPDGEHFASGGQDMSVILWSLEDGELARMTGHGDWLWSIAFSPDGQRIASSSGDGVMILWDVATRRALRVLDEISGSTTGVAFSPDGRLLASASGDGVVRLWDVASGSELRRYTGHASGVWSVAFTPDGQQLISASGDGDLILWRSSVALEDLVDWIYANRYVYELSCNERESFNLPLSEVCAAAAPPRARFRLRNRTHAGGLYRVACATSLQTGGAIHHRAPCVFVSVIDRAGLLERPGVMAHFHPIRVGQDVEAAPGHNLRCIGAWAVLCEAIADSLIPLGLVLNPVLAGAQVA
ncbi:WD40 repeat domain-containing protein [bacterium]|nr:WD40 repeat domain-containing protein [bacterium]